MEYGCESGDAQEVRAKEHIAFDLGGRQSLVRVWPSSNPVTTHLRVD